MEDRASGYALLLLLTPTSSAAAAAADTRCAQDCKNACVAQSQLGNGGCQENLECAELAYDSGDCCDCGAPSGYSCLRPLRMHKQCMLPKQLGQGRGKCSLYVDCDAMREAGRRITVKCPRKITIYNEKNEQVGKATCAGNNYYGGDNCTATCAAGLRPKGSLTFFCDASSAQWNSNGAYGCVPASALDTLGKDAEALPTSLVIVVSAVLLGCTCLCCSLCQLRRSKPTLMEQPMLEAAGVGMLDTDSMRQTYTSQFGYDKLRVAVEERMAQWGVTSTRRVGVVTQRTEMITNDSVSELSMGKQIGRGSYGIVFRGEWRGTPVAIKQLLFNPDEDIEQVVMDFRTEVDIMSRLRHRNVVRLLGFATRPKVTIIQEFMGGGSLYELLKSPRPLTDELMVSMALDTACGMQYLHAQTPPIIHRDLKSPNLLLTEEFTVKITDFGLARVKAVCSTQTQAMTQCGTPYWTAPEILNGEKYNESVDIYSFALCMIEMWSRRVPFEGQRPIEVAMQVVRADLRPPMPENCPEIMQELIRRCWSRDSSKRPVFAAVVDELRALKGAVAKGGVHAGEGPTSEALL